MEKNWKRDLCKLRDRFQAYCSQGSPSLNHAIVVAPDGLDRNRERLIYCWLLAQFSLPDILGDEITSDTEYTIRKQEDGETVSLHYLYGTADERLLDEFAVLATDAITTCLENLDHPCLDGLSLNTVEDIRFDHFHWLMFLHLVASDSPSRTLQTERLEFTSKQALAIDALLKGNIRTEVHECFNEYDEEELDAVRDWLIESSELPDEWIESFDGFDEWARNSLLRQISHDLYIGELRYDIFTSSVDACDLFLSKSNAKVDETSSPRQKHLQKIEGVFEHSDDFRSVVLHGKRHNLTVNQARVVEFLFDAYLKGMPDAAQSAVLDNLEIRSGRMRDVFKRKMDAWNHLFIRRAEDQAQGQIRLNLE